MKTHLIILSIMLSVLAWQITDSWIVDIQFWQFILIEILIAVFEVFTTFVKNKAEGKPTNFQVTDDTLQPHDKVDE